MSDNQLLLSYTVLDKDYENGALNYFAGQQDAVPGNVGSIDNPAGSNAPIASTLPDPVVFSYVYHGIVGTVRELLVKITSEGGVVPSSAVYTLLQPLAPPAANWPVLADNITLVETSSGPSVANDPRGLVQVENFLYLIDYESRKIYILGADELNGLPAGSTHTLVKTPFDLEEEAELPDDAKGQAIIVLTDGTTTYLYALYIRNDQYGENYQPSILVRLTVNPITGALTYLDQVNLGNNAQEIIPVTETGGNITLLIPAIGGMQQAGATNLTDSYISAVDPFATPLTGHVLLTGDPSVLPVPPPLPPQAYDLRAIAAPSRPDSNGSVYVLTGTYDNDYNQDFRLYKSTVALLLSAGGTYLSDAVTRGILTEVDYAKGMIGYFWDILYENAAGPDGDRLWFLRGAPILVSRAAAYGARSLYFGTGSAAGQIGGQVINSADLTAETVAQAKAGVSLKRGLRGTAPKIAEEEEQ